MPNLTFLNLTGCACMGEHTEFSDLMCPYLTKLKNLKIDNNHTITDAGMSQLTNLTHLHIYNVSKVSKSLPALSKLIDLDMYGIKITDAILELMVNLESLSATYCNISAVSISKLKVVSLKSCSWIIDLKGFETLPDLKEVNISMFNS